MSAIFKGRYTAQIDGPFVVFLIGMRVNNLWALRKWWFTATAMGPMVKELLAHPEMGLLHAQSYAYWRGAALVQYWRSFEDLQRFSRQSNQLHLPAWKRFNQMIGADGSVGIWHETYLVQAGQYECIYGNMPKMGLALAGRHVPVAGSKETAKRRLGMDDTPAVPSYPTPP